MTPAWRSPATGQPLWADTPHSLRDAGGQRWPVADGIAFLRCGREALAAEALACLDAGRREAALALLLADQDDWWDGPPADAQALAELVREARRLSLREAVALLGFGRVGDYFLHRWSDPTFLAGLALLQAHWDAPARAFELACGIGHYLRELTRRGVSATGGDVVFAKLWLARHWVAGEQAALVCFDAAHPWPVAPGSADLAVCHDALYFLEPKAAVVERLRATAGARGWLAVAHVHNRDWPNLSGGAAVSAAELAALFPDAVAYDDAELTGALVQARAPRPAALEALAAVEAFSLAAGPGLARVPQPLAAGLAMPPPGAPLRRNPLYRPAGADGAGGHVGDPAAGWVRCWPSARYAREYGARATYPARSTLPDAPGGAALAQAARRREFVDLPERW